MSRDTLQQHEAAAASARIRSTKKLVRELSSVKPLTREQRDRIVAAAATIPVIEASR